MQVDWNCNSTEQVDSDFVLPANSQQTRVSMFHFASKLCQYGVSSRAGAAIWNAAVKDLTDNGIVAGSSSLSSNLIADQFKVKREMNKFSNLQKQNQDENIERQNGLVCIGCDG